MKKRIGMVLLALMVIFAFSTAAACQQTSTYHVLFMKNFQGTVNNMPASYEHIEKGALVPKPSKTPDAYNYVFGGWYKDGACTIPWDFDADTVQGRTLLYAKWTHISETQCSVSFHANLSSAGEEIVNQYYVSNLPDEITDQVKGEVVSAPSKTPFLYLKTDTEETAVEGVAEFGGWFKEAECQNEFIFGTDVVTESTVLYAKWIVAG